MSNKEELYIDHKTLRSALSYLGLSAPLSDEKLGADMTRQMKRVIKEVAKLSKEESSKGSKEKTKQVEKVIPSEKPNPINTVPKNGTIVRLLVDFEANATEDAIGPAWTIGANNYEDDGVDEWFLVGWDWAQDCFIEGIGTPVGWLPMISSGVTEKSDIEMNILEKMGKLFSARGDSNAANTCFHYAQRIINEKEDV